MPQLPPINLRPRTGKTADTIERFARDQMLALLRIGTPVPIRDVPVDYNPVVVPPRTADVVIRPGQPDIRYRFCGTDERLVEATSAADGDWAPLHLTTPPVEDSISYVLRAGRTWVGANLRSIFMLDSRHGWIVGDESTILHTDDGGGHWRIRSSTLPATHSLKGIFFQDRDTGWIVGNGIFLRTRDGGLTWSEILDERFDLDEVWVGTDQKGWATGPRTTLVTENAGSSWEPGFITDSGKKEPTFTPPATIDGAPIYAGATVPNGTPGQEEEYWAVGALGRIFYRRGKGAWYAQRLFVYLHERVNLRLGVDTSVDISFAADNSTQREVILPYESPYPEVYLFKPQKEVAYQLVAGKNDQARVLSEPFTRGEAGEVLTLRFNPDAPVHEDETIYVKAVRTDILHHTDYLEKELRIHVQPNPGVAAELVQSVVDYGAEASLLLTAAQGSVEYQVFAYTPPAGEHLPDAPDRPDPGVLRHPYLPESHFRRAELMRKLGRYDEAEAHLAAAIRIHDALPTPLHPARRAAYVDLQTAVQQDREQRPEPAKSFTTVPVAPSLPEFIKAGEPAELETGGTSLIVSTERGWNDDILFRILARKKTGKGGSLWLTSPLPLLRVRPGKENLSGQLLSASAINGQAPAAIQLTNIQRDVAYRLVQPAGLDNTGVAPPAIADWGVGWSGHGQRLGMRVGIDLIPGRLPVSAQPSQLTLLLAAAWPAAEREVTIEATKAFSGARTIFTLSVATTLPDTEEE